MIYLSTGSTAMPIYQLQAKTATAARREAQKHAPCKLNGFDSEGNLVYISFIRVKGSPLLTATATANRSERPVDFVAIVEGKADDPRR